MDFSNQSYKDRLKQIHKEHEGRQNGNFDFFHQAQILWDETMAEAIAHFLEAQSDRRVIVLAGSGHIAFGDGIPKRVARRNGYEYVILLNGGDPEMDIADYVLFSPDIPFASSPGLMASVVEDKGKVRIAGLHHGNISKAGGLKVGDIILSIEGTPIHTAEDIRMDLLYREMGEKIKVRVMRKRRLSHDKEIILEVILPGSQRNSVPLLWTLS